MSNPLSKLIIRQATPEDASAINSVVVRCYGKGYRDDIIRAQILNFPDGHFVAVMGNDVVGYCASIIVHEDKALQTHTWRDITGGGFGSTHNPKGDYLYGYEVCVDPAFRRFRIGDRFYKARKKLCGILNRKGIVFGGRIPSLARKIKAVGNAEEYIKAVQSKTLRDPVLNFHLRQGFEIIGLLPDYIPGDKESMGYAVHLLWKNPDYAAPEAAFNKGGSGRPSDIVRVASVQYQQRRIKSFAEFEQQVTYFVDVCSDYNSDFVLFPEFFSLQLLSVENKPSPPHVAIKSMAKYDEQLHEMFQRLAIRYNINIIAGSHPAEVDNEIRNVARTFLRDGSVYSQEKIHPTPNERYWWNIRGGNKVSVIPTDCGPIGVLICYDSEFPELCRHLTNLGANILFVPFLTDERQSYCRVRYCAQARAVENQMYVVMSGSCGNLPNVNNIDIHYAQSCILTPCDFPFSRDGIAADTTPNVETIAFADLNLQILKSARQNGTVRNLLDRRHDLYEVTWHGE